jgi:hypothetical protein
MVCLWRLIRRLLSGRGLDAALRRNTEAADALDAALREVMKR